MNEARDAFFEGIVDGRRNGEYVTRSETFEAGFAYGIAHALTTLTAIFDREPMDNTPAATLLALAAEELTPLAEVPS